MKRYKLFIRHDGDSDRTFLGIFSETYCRSYCKRYAGSFGLHIYAEEVNN